MSISCVSRTHSFAVQCSILHDMTGENSIMGNFLWLLFWLRNLKKKISYRINSLTKVTNCRPDCIFSPLIYTFKAKSCWNPKLDKRISVCPLSFVRHAQATPPWILKRGGLESSGQRLIPLNGKTKRIAFLFDLYTEKNKKKKKIYLGIVSVGLRSVFDRRRSAIM